MFDCILYISKQPKNTLRKELHQVATLNNCVYKDSVNVTRPSIILSYSDEIESANYVYLSDKGRYYFVTNKTKMSAQKIKLDLEVDVLVSNQSDILSLSATIARNEFLKNAYLLDNNYSVYAYEQIVTKTFPTGFNSNTIILMTTG